MTLWGQPATGGLYGGTVVRGTVVAGMVVVGWFEVVDVGEVVEVLNPPVTTE